MGTFRGWAFAGTSAIAITASTVALWAFFGPSINGTTLLAGALGLTATSLAGAAYIRSGKAADSSEKMSADLDTLSRRLLRVESRFAEMERLPNADLRKSVAEVSGEIALLSGLLRDLASTVSSHDRDVATLAEAVYAIRERAATALTMPQMPAEAVQAMQSVASHQAATAAPPLDHAPNDWTSLLTDLPPANIVQPALTVAVSPELDRQRPAVEPSLPPANDSSGQDGIREGSSAPPKVGSAILARLQARHDERVAQQDAPAPAFVPTELPASPITSTVSSPAPESSSEQRKRAILAAFRDDRLEIHLQPIVSLPQRKTKFYEALARLRLDGETLLVPAEFMPTLEEAGLAPELDGKVAARAAAVARHLLNRGSDAFVTSNLSPAAMKTPGFLRALGRIMEAYPDVLGRIAFEISQRCWRTLDAETAGALEQLRAKGAFFLLDRAIDLRLDPLTLADRGVRYVKLPAQMLIDPHPSYGLDFAVTDLSTVLARAGIKLVADRVESEQVVPDLIEFEIPLAQGFVFAAPRAIRTDIFGAGRKDPAAPKAQAKAASAKSPAKPSSQPAQAAPQRANAAEERSAQPEGAEPRLPYRSFLRRAG
jgi:cyclic-di-GMP phosphodiesterase TipF (flagellum assembly factor)